MYPVFPSHFGHSWVLELRETEKPATSLDAAAPSRMLSAHDLLGERLGRENVHLPEIVQKTRVEAPGALAPALMGV